MQGAAGISLLELEPDPRSKYWLQTIALRGETQEWRDWAMRMRTTR
jgi:hypothetical protein